MEKLLEKEKQENIETIVSMLKKMDLTGIKMLTHDASTLILYQQINLNKQEQKEEGEPKQTA